LIARHPNARPDGAAAVLRETLALLREPDGRPYAAALALARRPELDPEEILILAEQQGASRRMRRGLLRNLAARDP
jgi:hypothetical protein